MATTGKRGLAIICSAEAIPQIRDERITIPIIGGQCELIDIKKQAGNIHYGIRPLVQTINEAIDSISKIGIDENIEISAPSIKIQDLRIEIGIISENGIISKRIPAILNATFAAA